MKRLIKLSIMMLVSAIVFVGCQKNEEVAKLSGVSPEDSNVQKRIFLFMQKMEYAQAYKYDGVNLKSGEERLSVDEAQWSMEAAANYQYANLSAVTSEIGLQCVDIDTDAFAVVVANNSIAVSDVSDVYKALCASLETSIAAHDTLQLFAVRVSIDIETDLVNVQYLYAQAQYPNTFHWTFQPYDYWYTNDGMGLCSGPYMGQCIGRSGETELNTKLQGRIPYYTPGPDWYLTDIEYLPVPSAHDDIHARECVDPDKYNLILNEMDSLAKTVVIPVGKLYLFIDYTQFDKEDSYDLYSPGKYKAWATYGKWRKKDWTIEYPYIDD